MTSVKNIIIQYNPDGVITQITKSPNAIDQSKAMEKAGVTHLLLNEKDITFDGRPISLGGFCVKNGKLSKLSEHKMRPSKADLLSEKLYNLQNKRTGHQPLPIHATKLSIALSGRFELLQEEAELKSMTPKELADKIIAKASEAMARENEYQAEVEALHAE